MNMGIKMKNINKWLEINIKDRLDFYKSSVMAGKYQRSKKECLDFASKVIDEKGLDADVFLLSL